MNAAHNAVIDEIRRKFRRPEVAEAETGDQDMVASPAARPEQEVESLQIDRGIRDCLSNLARPRRRAVTMHLLGYALDEIGVSLGWKRKRTEHLVYRGLADLRTCLSGKGLAP